MSVKRKRAVTGGKRAGAPSLHGPRNAFEIEVRSCARELALMRPMLLADFSAAALAAALPDPSPRFVDLCLASSNLQERMPADLRDRTRTLVWSFALQLAALDNGVSLVHGDFGKWNLLMRKGAGTWTVAAILDWEFAVSGPPPIDLGHFLRYECASRPLLEPHFSEGFLQAGGSLPEGWRRAARVVDSIALCESLTHDTLPAAVVAELLELVRSTVEDRDPQFS